MERQEERDARDRRGRQRPAAEQPRRGDEQQRRRDMLEQRDLGIGLIDLREQQQREEQAEQAALGGRSVGHPPPPYPFASSEVEIRTGKDCPQTLPRPCEGRGPSPAAAFYANGGRRR